MARANDNRQRRTCKDGLVRFHRLCFPLLPLLVGPLTGCGADGRPPTVQVWVGEVEDSDVAVGIVASSTRSTLFFCGGNLSFADHTHWFVGKAPLAEAKPIEDGAWQVTLSSLSERIVGNVTINGSAPVPFSAVTVGEGTLAGLYDASAPCGHAGLVVKQASRVESPAAQGACLGVASNASVVEQVNPVMPIARGADSGIPASLAVDESQRFTLHPLVLELN